MFGPDRSLRVRVQLLTVCVSGKVKTQSDQGNGYGGHGPGGQELDSDVQPGHARTSLAHVSGRGGQVR
eukprot:172528-Rhodomonas_salina.2